MECVGLREQQAGLELKVYGDQCRVRHLCGAAHPEEVSSSFLSFSILVSDVCVGIHIMNPGATGELEGGGGEGVGGPPHFVESGAGGDRRVGGCHIIPILAHITYITYLLCARYRVFILLFYSVIIQF